MRNTNALLFALVIGAGGSSVLAQTGGNAEAAKSKVSMCMGCHGIPMYHTAYPEVYSVPMIGGQSATYIVKALQEYKSGERSHPTMQGIAKGLTDQDMADVAAYYGGAAKENK